MHGDAVRSFSAVHVHHSPPHQHHADHHPIEKNDEKEQIAGKKKNNYFYVYSWITVVIPILQITIVKSTGQNIKFWLCQ